jgi:hypothetical protein
MSLVGKEDKPLFRQQPPELSEDGKTANARVEDADGVGVPRA